MLTVCLRFSFYFAGVTDRGTAKDRDVDMRMWQDFIDQMNGA